MNHIYKASVVHQKKSQFVHVFLFWFNVLLLLMFYQPFGISILTIGFTAGLLLYLFYRVQETTSLNIKKIFKQIILFLPLLIFFALPFWFMVDEGFYLRKVFFTDHAKHNAVTGALLEPGYPPINPYLVDGYLWYYWISYIPGAVICKLTHWPVFQVNRIMPIFYTGIFLKVLHVFFLRYLKPKSAIIAVYLVIVMGGWDWIYYFVLDLPFWDFIHHQPDLIWSWPHNDYRLMNVYNIERSMLYLWPHVFALSNLIAAYICAEDQLKYWNIKATVFLATALMSSAFLAPLCCLAFIMCFVIKGFYKGSLGSEISRVKNVLLFALLTVAPFYFCVAYKKYVGGSDVGLILNPLLNMVNRGSYVIERLKPFFAVKYVFLEFGVSVFSFALLFDKKFKSQRPFLYGLLISALILFVMFTVPGRTDWHHKYSIFLQFSMSAALILHVLPHPSQWLKIFFVMLCARSLPSTIINIYTYSAGKQYTARYSSSHVRAEQWIRQNIPRGKVFLAPPGNTFLTSLAARPVLVGDAHHTYLFFPNYKRASAVLAWRTLKTKNEILAYICTNKKLDYFWYEDYEHKYKFLSGVFPTVYENSVGHLLKVNCVE